MKAVQAVSNLLEAAGSSRVELSKVQPFVDEVEQAGAAAVRNVAAASLLNGNFKALLTTDTRSVSEDSQTTLGRLSFNAWKPNDTEIQMCGTTRFTGSFEGKDNHYVFATKFFVMDKPELAGLSLTFGEYSNDPANTSMFLIAFLSTKLCPAAEVANDPAKLKSWLEYFGPHNPDMDPQTGALSVTFPKSPVGTVSVFFMNDTLQVTKGNMGSVVVMERMPGDQSSPSWA